MNYPFDPQALLAETTVQFSRSGGKGGQHVNKVETKVELLFTVAQSQILSPGAQQLILTNLRSRIDDAGILHVYSSRERSQYANRQRAEKLLLSLIANALIPRKKRIATKVSYGIKEARKEEKRHISSKKTSRSKVQWD